MKKPPTVQELEIMKIVWEMKAATVRDVYEKIRERRRIAYTTVMTMMNIMESKGLLKKKLLGRAYLYEPSHPKSKTLQKLVMEFVNRVFNGSAEALVVQLIHDRRLSPDELDKIRQSIEEEK